MTLRRIAPALARLAGLVLVLTTGILLPGSSGCSRNQDAPDPASPSARVEVVGTLVAVKDDRAFDGGFELTLETSPGVRELVRVSSLFIVPPPDAVRAMHEVVEAARIGDRIRARGTRDESGALLAETLELTSR